jgi:NitT/TauT family transport system substrate-binding protein
MHPKPPPPPRRGTVHHTRRIGAILLLLASTTGCASPDAATTATEVRLGYFANVTHAPAIVGVVDGTFATALGDGVTLTTATFNAGTEAITALFSDALDLAFLGPNPAINGYAQSGGEAIRIVAGSTSGGASLIAAPGIDTPADLVGATVATPALGNTQDVALRAWLRSQGLGADLEGGGDVAVVPQPNAQTLETFRSGAIDAAWVPEPWATRLVREGGGHVLVDERDLWPDGAFVTTHLVVRTSFLADHPDLVEAVIEGLVQSIDAIDADPAAAQETVNDAIEQITGSALPAGTIAEAWSHLTFTVDPIAPSLQTSADHAVAAGLLDPIDLDGIYDLTILNEVLAGQGRSGGGS